MYQLTLNSLEKNHVLSSQVKYFALHKPVFVVLHEGVTKLVFDPGLLVCGNSYSNGERGKKKQADRKTIALLAGTRANQPHISMGSSLYLETLRVP